ncbi:MAG TPA: AAA family ATPase [Polyangiaceae bacterium]|nr:AAA family ATPase [Polyangiaceae bacterium]
MRDYDALAERLDREAPARAVLARGDTLTPEPISWIWDGWLARGKLHILAGAPGTGKTTLALAMAATISAGGTWPDGSRCPRGDVVIWSGEDDPADTIVPRLIAAGADLSRVHIVRGVREADGTRPYDPAPDTDARATALSSLTDVSLIVVDPIVSAVAGDSHHNAETRRSLQPLVDLGHAHSCALVGITHLSKGTAGRDPVERVCGSLAFGAIARVVMLAARIETDGGPPDQRVLCRAKSNIGPDTGGWHYTLWQRALLPDHPEMTASCIAWGAAVAGTARELLAQAEATDEAQSERLDITNWLRDLLCDAGGEMSVSDIRAAARDAGLAWRSVQRARVRAGARSSRQGFGGGSVWRLIRATSGPFAPFAPLSEVGANGANGAHDGATGGTEAF